MSIKTLDIEKLYSSDSNCYEQIVVMAKRTRQIAAREKMELDEKLKYFEGFEGEDEFTFNEEQENISKEYEKRLHPTRRAIEEWEKDEIYFRRPYEEKN